ncbi:NADH-quinone oxidoreductase subunit I 2-like [Panicum virgatum]|uniref:NADH-quinone oxidoreductase subunit I 2-like n=1 Tax=Panicum virgatum TaxID=38727 RepID=UPI0019D53BB8|nr:NADH-quinone oxidoreductase subunit I 2-like [Panicum virgatum]
MPCRPSRPRPYSDRRAGTTFSGASSPARPCPRRPDLVVLGTLTPCPGPVRMPPQPRLQRGAPRRRPAPAPCAAAPAPAAARGSPASPRLRALPRVPVDLPGPARCASRAALARPQAAAPVRPPPRP